MMCTRAGKGQSDEDVPEHQRYIDETGQELSMMVILQKICGRSLSPWSLCVDLHHGVHGTVFLGR